MEKTSVKSGFDLAVIGAGPAGSSAAITAARLGHSVLLLEQGHFPRQKVCGEFVSSEALHILAHLLPQQVMGLSNIAIPGARIFFGRQMREVEISPSAHSITRFVLDAALWQAAANNGVTCLEGKKVQRVARNGIFNLTSDADQFSARAVINAAGRWSDLNAEPGAIQYAALGLKRHFYEMHPSQSVDLYFFPGGYCGVQPISKDEVNVSALIWNRGVKSLQNIFLLNPALATRSAAWRAASEQVSTYPLVFRTPRPVDLSRLVLNAGDAAGFVDPFVGDGISMALHSGRLAAEALSTFLRGSSSLEDAAQVYARQYQRRLLPAFRNAERIRRVISSRALRGVAMELFRIPAISRLALRSTRVRAA